MSVKQLSNGMWQARVPRGDNEPGGKRREISKCFDLKKDAQKWEREQLQKIRGGEWVAPSNETLGQYLRRWVAQKLPLRDVRSRTSRKYAADLERYVIPHIGGLRLERVTKEVVKGLATTLLATPAKKGGKLTEEAGTLTPLTVRHALMALGVALGEAEDEGLIVRNPVRGIRLPKRRFVEPTLWAPAQLWRFLGAARDSEFGLLWTVLALTGMRPGEALGLMWSDFDRERGTLRVQRALSPEPVATAGQAWSLNDPKNGRSRRLIHLAPAAVEALERQRDRQGAERLTAGDSYRDRGFVFAQPDGAPYRLDRLAKALRKDCEAAGVPVIIPYAFRHQHSTWSRDAGVDLTLNAEQKGHGTDVAAAVYIHGSGDAQLRAMEKLRDFLDRARATAEGKE